MSRVLVTGGSGFVGSHCIVQLLHEGHSVRTTVRDLKREAEVQAMVRREAPTRMASFLSWKQILNEITVGTSRSTTATMFSMSPRRSAVTVP